MEAVLLISHGSRSPKTKQEVKGLVKKLNQIKKIPIFHYAFLEIESPSIPKGIDQCVGRGGTEIIVLLNFLNSGKHIDIDIPRIIRHARQKYPKVKIKVTKPVGQHQGVVDLFLDMIHEK